MITRLAISGYRSLRNVTLALGPLNIITGANGSGKSSLYRALHLLSDVAQGRVVASLAAEGGLSSTLWAGPEKISREMKRGVQPVQNTRRTGPISLRLGFASDAYGYAIDLGLPQLSRSLFALDPKMMVEAVYGRAICLAAPICLPNAAVPAPVFSVTRPGPGAQASNICRHSTA